MYPGVVIPDGAPTLSPFGLTINVWPNNKRKGGNVEILTSLLVQLGLCTLLWLEREPGWDGGDATLTLNTLAELEGLFAIRIIDWVPEDYETREWGGPSDNMLTLQCRERQTPESCPMDC